MTTSPAAPSKPSHPNDPGPTRTPPAEVDVDEALVRALLAEQHGDLAARHAHDRLFEFDVGWDNTMWRLGSEFVVRLPRRAQTVVPLEREQRWLPVLAPALPLAVPVPFRIGRPGFGYPWPWSVLRWIDGEPADLQPALASEWRAWADFLDAFHGTAVPADAPVNPYRGVPLAQREAAGEGRLARLDAQGQLGDAGTVRGVREAWSSALAAPAGFTPTWLHGDLHARNVLTEGGRFVAVIDWGDVCAGDPATDLASIWMLLPDAASRERAMAAYGPQAIGDGRGHEADDRDALCRRAKGWAVLFGVMLLESGLVDHPRHAAMGRLTLQRVAEGP